MKIAKIVPVVAVAFAAGSASAQFQFLHDDGTSDNAVGLTDGGLLGWMSVFETNENSQIQSIDLTFGSTSNPGSAGVSDGTPFNVFVFGDNDQDPTNGATLLDTSAGSVDGGSIDSDVFQSVPVNADVSGFDFFWAAAEVEHGAGTFPASLDQSQNSNGRSWAVVGSPGDDGARGGALEMDSIGIPGVWLLRATGVPAPGSLALLGLGGIAAMRRRR